MTGQAQTVQMDSGSEGRPSWLQSQFESVEDQAQAYNELRAHMDGSGGDPPPADSEPVLPSEPTEPVSAEPASQDLGIPAAVAGLLTDQEMQTYTQEYAAGDGLSDATYDSLKAKGLDRSLVDTYLAGQEAIVSQGIGAVHGAVGGEDNYSAMVQWAANSLSDVEKNAYNEAVNGGNPQIAALAAQGLYAKFNQSGVAPSAPLTRGTTPPHTDEGYGDYREMVLDMHDPEYQKNPAYRAKVDRKIAASPNLLPQ